MAIKRYENTHPFAILTVNIGGLVRTIAPGQQIDGDENVLKRYPQLKEIGTISDTGEHRLPKKKGFFASLPTHMIINSEDGNIFGMNRVNDYEPPHRCRAAIAPNTDYCCKK